MDIKKQHLLKVDLNSLRPTQMTVGYAEVQVKKMHWKHLKNKERKDFLSEHWFPGVLGPKARHYIIDHHHLGMALLEEEVEHTHLIVLKDFSLLDDEFWTVMEHHQWAHPYDEQGKRQNLSDIPKKITKLTDDPYRSLAGFARRAGACVKDSTPFAEFLWADFFRRRIKLSMLEKQPEAALKKALALAHSPSAAHLPGWSESIQREN